MRNPVVPVSIGVICFSINFFIVPLEGYEAVLRCQWLSTLGPILWDFSQQSMSFWWWNAEDSGSAWRHPIMVSMLAP